MIYLHLGQYFTGQLGEFPSNGWSPVEDNSWAEDPVEDVHDHVPDEGSGAAVVHLDLVSSEEIIVIIIQSSELSCLVDEESLDGGEDQEDEGGDDPHLGRDKVLLPLLPPVTRSQGWDEIVTASAQYPRSLGGC